MLPRLTRRANFWDRVSAKVMLKPLAVGEVRELIDARLRFAGYRDRKSMFTPEAVELISSHTEGFPRRVNLLCHNVLEHLVMHDKRIADLQVVHQVIDNEVAADDFKGLLDASGDQVDANGILRVVGE